MTRQKTLMTADEFFRLYSHKDGRYELVDGEVVEMAPVFRRHGRTASNITTAFNIYSRQRGEGWSEVEVGYTVRSGPDTVRGPDVSLILTGQPDDEDEGSGFVPGTPDIAVEVVSSFQHSTPRWNVRWLSIWRPDPTAFGSPTRPTGQWRFTVPTAPYRPTAPMM